VRIPRFFLPQTAIDSITGTVTVDDRQIVDQILKVLRLKSGNLIDFLDGTGKIYRCSLAAAEGEQRQQRNKSRPLTARIESESAGEGEARVFLSVALPILRPARFEWAIEKLTELGAKEIIPLVTTRSVGRESKLSRWQSIAREASEQCERALMPVISEPLTLEEYLLHLANEPDATIFICTERADESSADTPSAEALHMVLCNFGEKAPHKISVIVGAEGGFTHEEQQFALEQGAKPVSLGNRILRSETAAIYTSAIVMALLDQARTSR
jgi:16S rRNA (uracil1498-N3)-methyltransferase